MNTPPDHSLPPDLEERFDAWLARQPLTPAPDFTARTLARIRAESAMVASAQAGDDAALDTLLDRWLGESPVEPNFEPAELATQTRRTATREEQIRPNPTQSHPIIFFPAWARSAVALAAAAAIALMAYVGTTGGIPASSLASANGKNSSPKAAQVDAADDNSLPAPGSESYNPSALAQLNDSLTDGNTLLNDDVVALLPGVDSGNTDSAVE